MSKVEQLVVVNHGKYKDRIAAGSDFKYGVYP